MDTEFCVEALQDALDRYGSPKIFNADQGVQFTSAEFTGVLTASRVRISMDGKGRYLDNIFIERLWRSLKYEDVYIKAYASVPEARRGIGGWLNFYNDERLHQALGYLTPREMFETSAPCGYVDNASALTTSPQAHHQQQERNSIELEKAL
jgi:putative transposase